MKLQGDKAVFYDSAPSPVIQPPIRDRVFGIDVLDEALASKISDKTRKRYKKKLLTAGGT